MLSPTCLLPSRPEPTEKKCALRTKYTNLLVTDNKARFTLASTLPVAMALISSTVEAVHPLWAPGSKWNTDSKQLQLWNVCAIHSKITLVVKTQTMATETENYNREASEAIWTFNTRTQFITPASVAVHVMAVCMIKYEERVFMQTDSACAVDLHWLVRIICSLLTWFRWIIESFFFIWITC